MSLIVALVLTGKTTGRYEFAEQLFYAAFYLAGSVAAFMTFRCSPNGRGALHWRWLSVLAWVPLLSAGMTGIYTRNYAAGCVWFVLACLCLLAHRILPEHQSVSHTRGAMQDLPWSGLEARGVLIDAAVVCTLALALLPSSASAIAAGIGPSDHVVSFLLGPALYFFADGLIPGLDYHSHYGVGQGFAFSFLLGLDAISSIENYVHLVAWMTWAFYASGYLLVRNLLGSRLWSIGVIASVCILNFYGPPYFAGPSAWPIRYPLLLVFAWLFARLGKDLTNVGRQSAVGVCAGLSILWNTDIGIYMLAASGLAYLILHKRWSSALPGLLVLAGSTGLSFLLLSCLIYGPRVISIDYFWALVEPALLYGGGFYAEPINWTPGWGYVYNLPLQILAVTTIGWCAARVRSTDRTGRNDYTDAWLLILSILGLLLLVKWTNRSLHAVWHQNALPLAVMATWWLRRAFQWELLRTPVGARFRLGHFAGAAVVTGICAFLLFVQDPINQRPYALRGLAEYPNLAMSFLQDAEEPGTWPDEILDISPRDIQLIVDHVPPGERVAVMATYDWAYLVAAQRAPLFVFVPVTALVPFLDSPHIGDPPEIIFARTGTLIRNWMVAAPLWELVKTEYAQEEVGDQLALLRRKK